MMPLNFPLRFLVGNVSLISFLMIPWTVRIFLVFLGRSNNFHMPRAAWLEKWRMSKVRSSLSEVL